MFHFNEICSLTNHPEMGVPIFVENHHVEPSQDRGGFGPSLLVALGGQEVRCDVMPKVCQGWVDVFLM